MNREFRASKHRYFCVTGHSSVGYWPISSVVSLSAGALSVSRLTCGSSAYAQTVVDGGLTAAEFGWSLSPNLLVNGDFSQGTTGWTFSEQLLQPSIRTRPRPTARATLEMSDSGTCTSATPIAKNSLKVVSGQVYTLSGEMMTEDFVGTRVLRRRDVRSVRLWPFAGFDWHHRLDQHDAATYERPRGREHFGAPGDLRRGAHRKRMVCEHVAAAGDTAGAADVSAVPELPRHDVLGSEPGRQHEPDGDAAGRNYSVESSSRNQRGRRQRQHGCERDPRAQSTDFTASFDMSALPLGTYQVAGTLEDSSGNVLMRRVPTRS